MRGDFRCICGAWVRDAIRPHPDQTVMVRHRLDADGPTAGQPHIHRKETP